MLRFMNDVMLWEPRFVVNIWKKNPLLWGGLWERGVAVICEPHESWTAGPCTDTYPHVKSDNYIRNPHFLKKKKKKPTWIITRLEGRLKLIDGEGGKTSPGECILWEDQWILIFRSWEMLSMEKGMPCLLGSNGRHRSVWKEMSLRRQHSTVEQTRISDPEVDGRIWTPILRLLGNLNSSELFIWLPVP